MRRIGAIEAGGALMVANENTRLLGAAGLAAISAMMLAVEMRNREVELVLPRLALTGLAMRTAMAGRNALRAPRPAGLAMAFTRRTLLAAGAASLLARPALLRAQSSAPIRVGEINSYATQPAVTEPYRKGWEMAVSHLNDLGGLDGRKVEIVSRDDGGTPGRAPRAASELVNDEKVDLLAGGISSEVGLAISAYALQHKKLYVAGEPLTDALVWAKGNRYTYRVRPSTFMQAAMLVDTALTLPAEELRHRGAERRRRPVGGEVVPPAAGRRAGQTSASSASNGRRPAMSTPAPWERWPASAGCDLLRPDRHRPACLRPPGQRPAGCSRSRLVVAMLTGRPGDTWTAGGQTPDRLAGDRLSLEPVRRAGQQAVRARLHAAIPRAARAWGRPSASRW